MYDRIWESIGVTEGKLLFNILCQFSTFYFVNFQQFFISFFTYWHMFLTAQTAEKSGSKYIVQLSTKAALVQTVSSDLDPEDEQESVLVSKLVNFLSIMGDFIPLY